MDDVHTTRPENRTVVFCYGHVKLVTLYKKKNRKKREKGKYQSNGATSWTKQNLPKLKKKIDETRKKRKKKIETFDSFYYLYTYHVPYIKDKRRR